MISRIKCVEGLGGIREISRDWQHICRQMRPRFYHRVEWYRSYLETIEREPDSVKFFVLYLGEDPRAVVPLKQLSESHFGMDLGVLTFPDYGMPLHDIVAISREAAACAIKCIISEPVPESSPAWDVIRLQGVLADSFAATAVRDSGAKYSVTVAGKCSYIRCPRGEDAPRGMSKNLKRSLRRSAKGLEQNGGEVEFIFETCGEKLDKALSEFLRIENSGWKSRSQAVARDALMVEFFQRFVREFGLMRRCEVALMKLNGTAIAAQLSLLEEDTQYLMKVAYDEAFGYLSPGNVLMARLLRRITDSRMLTLNMISDELWHDRWRAQRTDLLDIEIHKNSWKVRLVNLLWRISC